MHIPKHTSLVRAVSPPDHFDLEGGRMQVYKGIVPRGTRSSNTQVLSTWSDSVLNSTLFEIVALSLT